MGISIETIISVLGGAGFTGIVLALLKWLRYRKNDNSTSGRTDAEAEKIKAEAYEIKSKADINIADAALKLAHKLGEDIEVTKKQLEKTQLDLERAMNSLRDATIQLHEVQHELNNERQKNVLMAQEINDLKAQLNQNISNRP